MTRPPGFKEWGRGKYHEASGRDRKRLHVRIAEYALGHALPSKACVHHVDGDKSNNARSNLVICQDGGYHALLHYRTFALLATGNANAKRCHICKQWDAPENVVTVTTRNQSHHKQCAAARARKRNAANGVQLRTPWKYPDL